MTEDDDNDDNDDDAVCWSAELSVTDDDNDGVCIEDDDGGSGVEDDGGDAGEVSMSETDNNDNDDDDDVPMADVDISPITDELACVDVDCEVASIVDTSVDVVVSWLVSLEVPVGKVLLLVSGKVDELSELTGSKKAIVDGSRNSMVDVSRTEEEVVVSFSASNRAETSL